MTEEVWKEIPGYEGLYEASTEGRVRRVKAGQGHAAGKILKPGMWGRNTNPTVKLHKDKQKKTETVHLLVAKTFMGKCPKGLSVVFLDGNHLNSRLDNLSYGYPGPINPDGMEFGEIAEKLKMKPSEVKEAHDRALEKIAVAIGMDRRGLKLSLREWAFPEEDEFEPEPTKS